ncbi:uncharacterized protein LOC119674105 [Teleopsis dalmanni]|uniref:uncharacterized protein LOC119674105 n=1 Tax=Teleopsis dalmanni TaxID=139649 RepID=UPI0018CF50B0|nr:uncharacterized protein LOC119674105 [Teleopsis dalmanni]
MKFINSKLVIYFLVPISLSWFHAVKCNENVTETQTTTTRKTFIDANTFDANVGVLPTNQTQFQFIRKNLRKFAGQFRMRVRCTLWGCRDVNGIELPELVQSAQAEVMGSNKRPMLFKIRQRLRKKAEENN